MADIPWTRRFPKICLGHTLRTLKNRKRQKKCLQSSWCTRWTQRRALPFQQSKIRKQRLDQYFCLQSQQHTAGKETRLRYERFPRIFLRRKANTTGKRKVPW